MRVRLNQPRLLAFLAQSPLSQNHWALKLGFSRGHWSEIVNGKHPYPSAKSRERMLEILGIPFDELFEIETGTAAWGDTDFRRAIADRYLIDSELGQGGMGAVYLARDARHGRVVAVKVVSPEAVSGIGVDQFLREIATVAHLQHPHILPLHDSGEAAGHPFFVMPYIRSGSLRARLKTAIRLPGDEVARLTRGVAAALEYAHSQRILHCDIKPENILLDGDHPYVMDFGIARKLHTEVLPWTLRKELDLAAGTPAYVSPEQASGEKDLAPRSDVYSLACVVYEMLAGRPPFEGTSTTAVISRRFIEPPTPLREFAPEVPPALERAVEQGMALEPRRRTATPAELSAALSAGARQASGALGKLSVSLTRGWNRLLRARRPVAVRFRSLLMESLWQDLHYALRGLRNSLSFAAVVVLTLALGIGANTAIFSVVRGVLLKPLPHRDGSRLVYLRQSADGPGQFNLTFSVPEVRDLRTGVPALAGIAEYSSFSTIHQTKDGPVRIAVGLVTGNYFEVMGLSPILGRVTQPGDDGPKANPVAVLTHGYWLSRFGGDSGVVGTTILLDRKPVTVIGVLQPAPFFPERVEALLNMVISSHHIGAAMQEGRTHRMTEVVARLKPVSTLEQVRAEIGTVYGRLQQQYKDAYPAGSHYRVAAIPFKDVMGERARLTLWLLMASAAFVLIVSAANVANLTLMRGVRRDHELVVRAALGAGLPRLRRLLLVENLVLTFAGAALGVLIANSLVRLLTVFAGRFSPRAADIRLDGVVFGFTLLVSVAVALVLSYLTSLPREGSLASRILTGAHRISGTLRRQRVQRGLVVVQVAVTVVLLAGAGLLTRTMIQLSKVNSGLISEDVLTMQVTLLTRAELQDSLIAAGAAQRLEQIRAELSALPGVTAVGLGGIPPLRSSGYYNLVEAEGKPLDPGAAPPRAEFRSADPDFFRASGIPLLRGRAFRISDQSGSTAVTADGQAVIINQVLADRFFPNQDPIGRRLGWKADWFPDTLHWQTIVGVVGNTRDGGLDSETRPVGYWPTSRFELRGGALVIRADHEAEGLAGTATRLVRRIAPDALIENVKTIAQFREESVASRRLNTVLISSFGLLAVVIAAVGIAGVLGFSVSARTNEIGIRMSLGADRGKVHRMILREGGVLLLVGLALGLGGAFLTAGVIRRLLYGIAPHDPATFIGVAVLMTAIGLTACWIPALRAARIDPAIAMRAE